MKGRHMVKSKKSTKSLHPTVEGEGVALLACSPLTSKQLTGH